MLIFVIAICFFVMLAASFFLYDQLVRLEYEEQRDKWEADGKPMGYFWMPDEAKSFGGLLPKWSRQFTRDTSFLLWLSETPEWMKNEPKALSKLKWCRVLFVVGMMGGMGAVIAGIALSSVKK